MTACSTKLPRTAACHSSARSGRRTPAKGPAMAGARLSWKPGAEVAQREGCSGCKQADRDMQRAKTRLQLRPERLGMGPAWRRRPASVSGGCAPIRSAGQRQGCMPVLHPCSRRGGPVMCAPHRRVPLRASSGRARQAPAPAGEGSANRRAGCEHGGPAPLARAPGALSCAWALHPGCPIAGAPRLTGGRPRSRPQAAAAPSRAGIGLRVVGTLPAAIQQVCVRRGCRQGARQRRRGRSSRRRTAAGRERCWREAAGPGRPASSGLVREGRMLGGIRAAGTRGARRDAMGAATVGFPAVRRRVGGGLGR